MIDAVSERSFFCWFFKTINFINFTLWQCALGTEQIRQLHRQALIKSTKQFVEIKSLMMESIRVARFKTCSFPPDCPPCTLHPGSLASFCVFLVREWEKQALPESCQAVEELLDYSILFSLIRQWNWFFASRNCTAIWLGLKTVSKQHAVHAQQRYYLIRSLSFATLAESFLTTLNLTT